MTIILNNSNIKPTIPQPKRTYKTKSKKLIFRLNYTKNTRENLLPDNISISKFLLDNKNAENPITIESISIVLTPYVKNTEIIKIFNQIEYKPFKKLLSYAPTESPRLRYGEFIYNDEQFGVVFPQPFLEDVGNIPNLSPKRGNMETIGTTPSSCSWFNFQFAVNVPPDFISHEIDIETIKKDFE